MKVRFWGTRGSFAKPGPGTVRYGGNTSCVEVVTDGGTRLVIDCGTGAHDLGRAILAEGASGRGHMLISHTHWDHIQGIPFFAPFFVPGQSWDIYAPQGFGESLADTLAGQMEYTYFPVTPDAFGAEVRYTNLGEGAFSIDDVRIETQYLNHPALALAFRIEADGATLVYACDHEPHARALGDGTGPIEGQDARHAAFVAGADLLIHDAQYLAAEYPAKVGWGHSTVEYALAIARHGRVARLALTHHDPARDDAAIDAYLAGLDVPAAPEVFAAAEGLTIELRDAAPRPARRETRADAVLQGAGAGRGLLLLVTADDAIAARIADAIASEPVDMARAPDAQAAETIARAARPTLVIVDDAVEGVCGAALGRALAAMAQDHDVPVMVLGNGAAPPDAGRGVDWLEAPFSTEYARTRIRTWLMRTECQWKRAPVPDDEEARLAALRALDLDDPALRARFDRHTRIAAALFDVPVALVSVVDSDRQLFVSCYGTELCDTPRDMSFCAHAVAEREALIVPDALRDPRFRDNPLVAGPPHVRFYAGAPLFAPSGHCIGTLCLIDMRPHALSDAQVALLRDLAGLVEAEMASAPAAVPGGRPMVVPAA